MRAPAYLKTRSPKERAAAWLQRIPSCTIIVHKALVPIDAMMNSARRYLLIDLLLLLLIEACTPSPQIPVKTLWFANQTSVGSYCLFVFLPGRWDSHTDFLTEGFIGSVRERRLPVDMLAADLHIGYYRTGSAVERLRDDIVGPSRKKGYRDIWLIGVSLGALGALSFEARYPHMISGIVLLGPFLGGRDLVLEIERAGGVLAWKPGEVAVDDYQRRLWEWVQRYAQSNPKEPPIYLAFGSNDRLSASQRLLATVLPPGRVATTNGGHDWETWRPLWHSILDRLGPELESCAHAP